MHCFQQRPDRLCFWRVIFQLGYGNEVCVMHASGQSRIKKKAEKKASQETDHYFFIHLSALNLISKMSWCVSYLDIKASCSCRFVTRVLGKSKWLWFLHWSRWSRMVLLKGSVGAERMSNVSFFKMGGKIDNQQLSFIFLQDPSWFKVHFNNIHAWRLHI